MCFFPPCDRSFRCVRPYLWASLFIWALTSPCSPLLAFSCSYYHPAPLLIRSLSLFQDNSRIENHNPHIQTPFGRPVIYLTRLICLLAQYQSLLSPNSPRQTHILHSTVIASFCHLGSWINRVNLGLRALVAASSILLIGEVHLSSPR